MGAILLDERFDGGALDPVLRWFCEPADWSIDEARQCLRLTTASESDFWQRTHYGFQADNGHVLCCEIDGDFAVETWVRFQPVHQYDQAGLMVRISPGCWIKTSVEYEPDEPNKLGAVVTNGGYSDWSTQDVPDSLSEVGFRIRREKTTYTVEAALSPDEWMQIRLCHLSEDEGQAIPCGLYACSPKAGGFAPEFTHLRISALK